MWWRLLRGEVADRFEKLNHQSILSRTPENLIANAP
jgi:hypothetical protein